jgi:hypothetical protein
MLKSNIRSHKSEPKRITIFLCRRLVDGKEALASVLQRQARDGAAVLEVGERQFAGFFRSSSGKSAAVNLRGLAVKMMR